MRIHSPNLHRKHRLSIAIFAVLFFGNITECLLICHIYRFVLIQTKRFITIKPLPAILPKPIFYGHLYLSKERFVPFGTRRSFEEKIFQNQISLYDFVRIDLIAVNRFLYLNTLIFSVFRALSCLGNIAESPL